jgi:hypothetical protein
MSQENFGPKYPHIKVKLVGKDGNAFSILGFVTRAMRKANLPKEEIDKFIAEASSGDYDHLLRTCTKWVAVS